MRMVRALLLARLVVLVRGEVVRTVHEDDPVLRAVLEQEEGGGWRPLALELECPRQERRLSDFCQRQIENYQGCVHSQAGRDSLFKFNKTGKV